MSVGGDDAVGDDVGPVGQRIERHHDLAVRHLGRSCGVEPLAVGVVESNPPERHLHRLVEAQHHLAR
ncbi:MAG: hypothetical protein U5R31_04190 [Acidimicrobiia bacterium]|nr:hypothetical protein [Acidimicrobiia bacterium]